MDSSLVLLQTINAIKSFFYTALGYKMSTVQILKMPCNNLDKELCEKFKELINLPQRASVNYIYGQQNDGLLGIPLAGEDSDIVYIDNALKLLTSPDDIVRNTTWVDLKEVNQCCINHTTPTIDDYSSCLSSTCRAKNPISSH